LTIRAATLDDIPALLDMGARFHEGSAYRGLIDFSKVQVSKTLNFLIENDGGCVFVNEADGVLTGAIAGLMAPHFVSGDRFATELAWWVDTEARGTVGPRLLKRLEEWAKDNGARTLSMIEPPGNPGVGRIYERFGYRLAERNYMKAL
jgi:GNAT superfamily N-acetyltransferase